MPKRIVKDTFEQAKGYIFLLLKIRFRSERKSVISRARRGFSEPTVDEAVGYFKAIGLVDDRQFTRKWIASRLNKPFGIHRIRFELKEKGITPELMKEELEQAMTDYSEADVVANLAKRQTVKISQYPSGKS